MLIPVILSGGAGSRLWPVSREAYPKPFIRLADGQSLLQKTFERAMTACGADSVITVTNREYYFLTKDEYAKLSAAPRRLFILEPCGRNTAPAVAMAALHAAAIYGASAQLLVLPADHLIENEVAFREAVEEARLLADNGTLVTFGIVPTRAETAYGYIECGAPTSRRGSYRVDRFVEKPSAALATGFVSSGRFFWNSGMFCFNARAYLDALRRSASQLHAGVMVCWNATDRTNPEKIDLSVASFEKLDDISIDYAVMEKHPDVAVVRADFAWNDIGSWNALGELTPADSDGNRICGEAITIDTSDCFIQSDSRLVAAVGVKDLIVVDTPDALLISDRARAQDVKQVVSVLKVRNHASLEVHRTVHRPWGTYTVLEEGAQHKIKRIVVAPQASLSLQMHRHRSEHWVVVSGTALVVNGDREFTIGANESTFIPAGHKHRLANRGEHDLVIIEVQTGTYLGEDDIVRYDDVYGRVV